MHATINVDKRDSRRQIARRPDRLPRLVRGISLSAPTCADVVLARTMRLSPRDNEKEVPPLCEYDPREEERVIRPCKHVDEVSRLNTNGTSIYVAIVLNVNRDVTFLPAPESRGLENGKEYI